MLRNNVKKLVNLIWSKRETIVQAICLTLLAVIMIPTTAYAASYTAPLDNFKTVMTTLAKSAGTLLVIWGVIALGLAWKKQDQHGEFASIATAVAGAVVYSAGEILPIILP